ncbi:unnamed protein product [Caenorhabditis auriculariae]|uniref:Uncharacterized protein n=1 Tax=Caenorhabditis auriculariae TaxID=2777116 RepID=A0A8S1H198_9PELO|nr:unnamed protein product [Caenorhabditis auriculariae]
MSFSRPLSPSQRGEIENLIENDEISEASITQTIHERYKKRKPYTKASEVLIAVNSFEKLPIYGSANIRQHAGPNKQSHIYGVARAALARIIDNASTTESIVLGGESASGKSFNAREVFRYFASQSNSRISLKEADAIHTVLRSFGCARTLKNDAATRFGYSLDLLYQKSQLSGINLKYTLPIEVSRVVAQKPGERNFNIFYEIYHGLHDDAKNAFGIRDLQMFFYLNQGKTTSNVQEDEDRFDALDNALGMIGFSEDHRLNIYKIVSTILHIGNIYFRMKKGTEYLEIGNSSEIKWIAFLLELEYDDLKNSLLQRSGREEGDEPIPIASISAALDNRDALAMFLYEELFKWILSSISLHFKCPKHTGTISIVDFYGFERYNNNGLEEFIVNSVNERMENIFVKHAFHDQLVDYLKDGIMVDYKVPSSIENGKVVELLYKKPYGLLPLLTDECKFPKGSDETYVENCNLNHLDKSCYGKARSKERVKFSVRHYAGTIWYNAQDFVRKNRKTLSSGLQKALSESRNAVISLLFRSIEVREGADHIVSTAQATMIGCQTLIDKINGTNAQFVRCIRSNNERQPFKFDIPVVNRQVKSLLIAELLRFRTLGYPIKILKQKFAQQYRCLLPGDIAMCQNEKEIIQDILQGQGVKYENDFKIGNDYVFLREKLADRYETLQYTTCRDAAFMIQKTIKGYIARKNYKKKKAAIVKLQAGVRGWRTRRDYASERERILAELGKKRPRETNDFKLIIRRLKRTIIAKISLQPHSSAALTSTKMLRIVTNYLTIPIKNFLQSCPTVTVEQFAEQNFKGHLLEPRREPIMTPFLPKESEIDFRLSVEIFKLLLKYMNDNNLEHSNRDDLARYYIAQGISNPCQRDEILVQIANQVYKNPNKIAVERGWKLMHMAISSLFKQQPNALREQLFSTLQRRLRIFDTLISRELPSSNLELLVNNGVQNTVVEVSCFDGPTYDIQVHPWATAEDVADRILRQRGVGAPMGWTVEVDTPNRIFAPTGTHFIHDVFACVDGVEADDEKPVFYSFPPEKLIKPKEKPTPKIEALDRVMSPTIRKISDRHGRENSSDSHQGTLPRVFSPVISMRKSSHNTPNDTLNRSIEEEPTYSYTLPLKNKNKSRVEEPPEPLSSREKSLERIQDREIYEDNSHSLLTSPKMPRKKYSRPETEEYQPINFAPPPTFQYPQQMPYMQYVPVMMHPQQMMAPQGMMSTMPMMHQPMIMQPQALYSYTPQYPQVPQYPAPIDPPRPEIPSRNRSRHSSERIEEHEPDYRSQSRNLGFDSVRSRGTIPEHLDVRARSRGDVPSEYSTMSVASRIRHMPVPENSKDVDRFLDAVFDQILSPDEHQKAEINPVALAKTIKGGNYIPRASYEKPSYNAHRDPYQHNSHYNTITKRRDEGVPPTNSSPMRMRAQSVPRHVAMQNDGYINMRRNYPPNMDYSSDQSTSSEEHYPQNRGRSRERYQKPKNGSSYGQKQPVYMMMPVQVNEDGSMQPVMMSPQMMQDFRMPSRNDFASPNSQRSRKVHHSVDRMSRRSPSVDTYQARPPMIRRTPDDVERIQMPQRLRNSESPRIVTRPPPPPYETLRSPRAASRSRERMEAPMMTRQIPPRIDHRYATSNTNNAAISPEPRGLNRLPVEKYTDPAVKSSKLNSEHLNPNKFNVEYEKAVAQAEKNKSKEAINKLNDQLKRLPPPVDNVVVIRPRVQRVEEFEFAPAIERPQPQPIYVPPEPAPYFVPPPVVETPPPQPKWIVEDSVDRPENLQGRTKAPKNATPSPPIPSKTVEKPAFKYVKAPWKLTIRKEMFYPGEVLNDIQVIDQVFAQVIEDCRKSYPYRIRLYERQQVEEILREDNVPPEHLNNQTSIHPDTKVRIIENARQWPIYFSQIYEVIEMRTKELVNVLFSISEHGVRILLHTPHDLENPLKVQDHFPFETMLDVVLESSDILAIHTRQEGNRAAFTVRIKTKQAAQIKKTLDKCLSGEVEKRKLVRALENYATNEPNHLSFNRGDIIELLPAPEGDAPPIGNWLYGRIGNQFGYLLPRYVDSNFSEDIPPLRFESSDERDEHEKFFVEEETLANGKYTMLEYARKRFRQSKESKRKDDWTWNELAQMIKYSQKPITQSLHAVFNAEDSKSSVEMFTSLMKFMGDIALKKSETFTDVVFKILLQCHHNLSLIDELYCQIIKQTTSNVSVKSDSALRGWRLLTIVTAYFRPTAAFQPYLQQYLAENSEDVQRQYHGTAKTCFDNLQQTLRYGGRKVLLSAMELQEATDGNTIRRQNFNLSNNHNLIVNIRSVTVVEEVIHELCNSLNVRSLHEQEEFSLCYVSGKDKKLSYCKMNEYILDICTDMEHKKIPFQFYLKRTIWAHPLRLDNAAYIDTMFEQVIDDYLRGTYISTNSSGQLTASTTADIVRLAALLHLLTPEKNKPVKTKHLNQIFPKTVFEPKHRAQEEWANRVNRELELCSPALSSAQVKGSFLELLSTWPLLGVSHFRLRSAVEDGAAVPETTLSIGKEGVQLLQPKSQEVYKQWSYQEIISVESIHKTAFKLVRIMTGSPENPRTLEFQSDKADEITHLIGQYLTIQQGDVRRSTEL